MSTVYQVTVTDHADFSRVVHESFWANQPDAETYGNIVLENRRNASEPEYHDALELTLVAHRLNGVPA